MKTYSTTNSNHNTGVLTHPYGSRVRTRAQHLLGCLALSVTAAVPCGTMISVGAEPIALGTAADFGALAGGAISGPGDHLDRNHPPHRPCGGHDRVGRFCRRVQ